MVRASAVTSPASAAARACLGLGLGLARGGKPPCYYAWEESPSGQLAILLLRMALA